MSASKKIILVFLVTVLLPVIAVIIGGCVTQGKYFLYQYNCSKTSFYIVNFVLLIGALLIIYVGHKERVRSKLWYLISGGVIFVVLVNISTLLSFSNFGF